MNHYAFPLLLLRTLSLAAHRSKSKTATEKIDFSKYPLISYINKHYESIA